MNTSYLRDSFDNIAKIEKKIKDAGHVELALELTTHRVTALHSIRHLEQEAVDKARAIAANPKRYHGYFTQTSDKMMVSDPCYSLDTWCQHVLDNVKAGQWMTTSTLKDEAEWGIRVAEITAFIGEEPKETDFVIEETADIGVDSGQAGFFDFEGYKTGKENDDRLEAEGQNAFGVNGSFYNTCCNVTLGDQQSGTVPQGFVSSSGYGDGSYPLHVVRNEKGKVTAVKVVFISDDDSEEE